MSKPRPTGFISDYEDGPHMVITEAWSDPSYRGPGRPPGPSPRSRANAEAAAASVLSQQAKRPNAKETTLIAEAVGKHGEFHVSPPRVREALKALRNKEK
jgi:hypothetical protein